MSRALITLRRAADYDLAIRWISQAPEGTRVEFKKPVRSIPQNDLMWARLTEIARHVDWYGKKLTPDDWKDMFTAALRAPRAVPNLDGTGFVVLGQRTSDMTVEEMTNLLDLIDAFAAQHGVSWPWEKAA